MAGSRVGDVHVPSTKHDDSHTTAPDLDGRVTAAGKKRTRTGCLNCRRKRRKCDENKPTCEGCQARKETCEWGVRVSFRPENAQTMGPEHPSMRHALTCARAHSFQIINVTKEVIRDYFEETANNQVDETRLSDVPTRHRRPSSRASLSTQSLPTFEATAAQQTHVVHPPLPLIAEPEPYHNEPVAQTPFLPEDLFLSPQYSDSAFEDGIFLPGSEYQQLHAALRSRIIDTARSTAPSRLGTPEPHPHRPSLQRSDTAETEDEESRALAHLSAEEEYFLWQNYIDEAAPWMDKFDINRHFELVLPMLAKHHPHLRYSCLALSARQIERKSQSNDNARSLALYQHAIHLLSPLLHQRTSVVLASCVVLCVLEMMSCSPKAWRRHLDGCAALIQALGMNGNSGGLDEALFWCFARMDICGSLISSERTLIPMDKWIGPGELLTDYTLLLNRNSMFDMYANRMVYLCGRVVDLLCSSGKWEQRGHLGAHTMDANDYLKQWSRLFEVLERWYLDRPEEMKPLLTITSPSGVLADASPFQTLLYGNGPGVSGNQMYHTAALLMLKFKPSHIQFAKKPYSILWHARMICAISISNSHHGCWTNSVQPLWIAGQHMSHPSEHQAILGIYERIERETGWATRWRADDLREYWGESED
ncbi:hypothetical protein DOTSEDRAFT_71818 [Dothistroma septosporum NZE10]|uniref:Zn(2)-C6 fungal-type domain-containing protein n=1 Tax=Dothistroma septosporum (strain NZE10 / CBS 128990) TaxID=675120 RepID=N1PP38_DOTSN|nr:hypothetical protein DOTSEDRAFT_71818 [Dothistroma septosporum NZE10]